jgi:hypothetical protein
VDVLEADLEQAERAFGHVAVRRCGLEDVASNAGAQGVVLGRDGFITLRGDSR